MVEIITYSLKNQQHSSDQYYRDIAGFTDQVLEHGSLALGQLLNQFQQHVAKYQLEDLRSQEEYLLDFLVLGTIFRLYAADAGKLAGVSQKLLAWLYRIRQQHLTLKPMSDLFRGILSGLLVTAGGKAPVPPTYKNFTQLLAWMQAAGDFSEESKRLALWDHFLADQKTDEQAGVIQQAISLAEWFKDESDLKLGQYTPNVDGFLHERHPSYRWREDRIFCGRRREEYHLNMVGTEILNRSFRQKFLETEQKIVLLPPCMKARQDGTCQAEESRFGDRCGHCTPTCRIHQITLLGEKNGFVVAIIPHELSVFSSGKLPAPHQASVGLVGVSCPVTNVTGGWETKDLGIPAQGVLLDYCGCHWHWHQDGIPTDLNLQHLISVVAPARASR